MTSLVKIKGRCVIDSGNPLTEYNLGVHELLNYYFLSQEALIESMHLYDLLGEKLHLMMEGLVRPVINTGHTSASRTDLRDRI